MATQNQRVLVSIVGLAALCLPNMAQAQQVRLEARLFATNASPLASGQSRFEARPGRIRFSTEVEDTVRGTAVTVVVIRPNGGAIILGSVVTNALGFADLNLDSRFGRQIPMLVSGDIVQVVAPGNVVIVQGQLQAR